jgi:hypothetical protein
VFKRLRFAFQKRSSVSFPGFRDNKLKRNWIEDSLTKPSQRMTASGSAPSVAFQTEDEPPTVQERVQALAARLHCDVTRGAQAPTAQAVHLGEQPPPPHLNGCTATASGTHAPGRSDIGL